MGFLDDLLRQLGPPQRETRGEQFVKQVQNVRVPEPVIEVPKLQTALPITSNVYRGRLTRYANSADAEQNPYLQLSKPGKAFEIVASQTTVGANFRVIIDGQIFNNCKPGFFYHRKFDAVKVTQEFSVGGILFGGETWGQFTFKVYDENDPVVMPINQSPLPWVGLIGIKQTGDTVLYGGSDVTDLNCRVTQKYNATNDPNATVSFEQLGMPVGPSGSITVFVQPGNSTAVSAAITGGYIDLYFAYPRNQMFAPYSDSSLYWVEETPANESKWCLDDSLTYSLPAASGKYGLAKTFSNLPTNARVLPAVRSFTHGATGTTIVRVGGYSS